MIKETDSEVLNNLSQLIEFKTVSAGKTPEGLKEIEAALTYIKEGTLTGTKLFAREIEKNGILSLIVGTSETNTPDITLLAHVDVVPAPGSMFKLESDSKKIFGRGVADMKFAIPVFMDVVRKCSQQKNPPSISMLITSDEEVGSANGAKYIAEELEYRPKLLFVPDGGMNWTLIQKAKGAIQIKVNFKGTSAHASRPWEGESANDKLIDLSLKMRRVYPQIKREDWDSTTMNIGIIKGGSAGNQVADNSEVLYDLRFSDKKTREKILNQFRKSLPKHSELSIAAEAYLFEVDPNEDQIKRFVDLLGAEVRTKIKIDKEYGATDARFFNQYGIPSLVIMPPCGGVHKNEEWMSLEGLMQYHKALLKFILD